jgi:hypothetical protein
MKSQVNMTWTIMPFCQTNDFFGSWSHALYFSWHAMKIKTLKKN